jgi:hypothetical protein
VNDIRINGASDGTAKYTFAWYDGISDLNSLTEVVPAVPGNILDVGTYPTIDAGSYYFIVQKTDITDPVGYGCKSAPYEADIDNTAIDPGLAFVSTANQSCDPATVANGTIKVTTTPGSGSSGTFDYTWTAFPGANPGDVAGGGTVQNYSGQIPGLYTVGVQDNGSLCKTSGSVTIADNPVIPVVQDADISTTDQTVCKPEGSATVNDVLINGVSDGTGSYSFEWYRGLNNLNSSTQITPAVAGPAINIVNYPTIGAATYYFIATKTDVTDPVGYGCKTSPYQAVISDIHTDPSLAFTSSSNQSCDPATIANGKMSVTVTAGSSTSNLFDYTFTSYPPGGAPAGTWPDGVAQNYTGLIAGQYSVTIQDTNSKCSASGSVNINDNPVIPVVKNADITTTDQMICAPDGSITVNNIYVGTTADGTGKYTFD